MKAVFLLNFSLFFSFNILSQAIITFEVANTPNYENIDIGLRGDSYPLSWDKSQILEYNPKKDVYQTNVSFPDSVQRIEYKFVVEAKKEVIWEGNPNRSELIISTVDTLFPSSWGQEKLIDLSTLPLLSSDELKEDFQVIKNAILKVHPGLYRYNSELEIEKHLEILEAKFNQPLSYADAFLAISLFINSIKCDHTSASYWNQEGLMNSLLHRQKNRIPFTFLWLEEKMIVVKNASQTMDLRKGDEILSINGVEVKDILEAMLPYINADGNTLQNKVRKSEIDGFTFRFNAFDVLFPLLYPVKDDDFTLTVKKTENQDVTTIKVESMTSEERAKILASRYGDFAKGGQDLWSYKMLDNKVGYLQIGSFDTGRFTLDWKSFLAEAFSTFQAEAKDIIIDLRENQGGMDDASYELRKYLFKNKCKAEFFQSQSRFLVFPEEVKPFIKTWDYWFYNLQDDEHYQKGQYYVFPRDQKSQNLKPGKKTFRGNIYLLTSGNNVSGAFYLANIFRECQVGTIVGEETGGNLRGVNGGAILFLKPPNSRINVNLPVVGSFSKEAKADSGVVPDIIVRQTIKDLLEGKDTVLEKTLQTIKENRT